MDALQRSSKSIRDFAVRCKGIVSLLQAQNAIAPFQIGCIARVWSAAIANLVVRDF